MSSRRSFFKKNNNSTPGEKKASGFDVWAIVNMILKIIIIGLIIYTIWMNNKILNTEKIENTEISKTN